MPLFGDPRFLPPFPSASNSFASAAPSDPTRNAATQAPTQHGTLHHRSVVAHHAVTFTQPRGTLPRPPRPLAHLVLYEAVDLAQVLHVAHARSGPGGRHWGASRESTRCLHQLIDGTSRVRRAATASRLCRPRTSVCLLAATGQYPRTSGRTLMPALAPFLTISGSTIATRTSSTPRLPTTPPPPRPALQ